MPASRQRIAYMRIMLAFFLAAAIPNSYAEVVQLRQPGAEGQTLALHCIEPAKRSTDAVLFIHGASFPTMLAAGFEFQPKDSWMNFMANRGYLACGLDFLGFGASSRPSAMERDPKGATPLDTAAEAAIQISVATDYMIQKRLVKRLHLIAHS